MDTDCINCGEKFEKDDEVVITNAYGVKDLVHNHCLHDYVLGASSQDYYDTYEEYLAMNKRLKDDDE